MCVFWTIGSVVCWGVTCFYSNLTTKIGWCLVVPPTTASTSSDTTKHMFLWHSFGHVSHSVSPSVYLNLPQPTFVVTRFNFTNQSDKIKIFIGNATAFEFKSECIRMVLYIHFNFSFQLLFKYSKLET